jgi:hypothetical protein
MISIDEKWQISQRQIEKEESVFLNGSESKRVTVSQNLVFQLLTWKARTKTYESHLWGERTLSTRTSQRQYDEC